MFCSIFSSLDRCSQRAAVVAWDRSGKRAEFLPIFSSSRCAARTLQKYLAEFSITGELTSLTTRPAFPPRFFRHPHTMLVFCIGAVLFSFFSEGLYFVRFLAFSAHRFVFYFSLVLFLATVLDRPPRRRKRACLKMNALFLGLLLYGDHRPLPSFGAITYGDCRAPAPSGARRLAEAGIFEFMVQ
jgi:hypothetical protein